MTYQELTAPIEKRRISKMVRCLLLIWLCKISLVMRLGEQLWVSLHNGGGVGWGEVINGGFGMLIDGSEAAKKRIESMLHWDVNNGVARRAWARNPGAIAAISQAMSENNLLKVTLPNLTDDSIFDEIMK